MVMAPCRRKQFTAPFAQAHRNCGARGYPDVIRTIVNAAKQHGLTENQ